MVSLSVETSKANGLLTASSAPLTTRHWATETTPRGVEPRVAQEGSLNHNSLPLPVLQTQTLSEGIIKPDSNYNDVVPEYIITSSKYYLFSK
ncbi:hypothetical protein RJ640_012093 [Escallonia rubra]|uniref:Uncharacterized protein n=1 Tax=Escallonia rubra TaxID=112253 RepID=A0AA88SN73_9ASTE|nr:hypothetical protein RJ640_012093 [Escallonia rubra]